MTIFRLFSLFCFLLVRCRLRCKGEPPDSSVEKEKVSARSDRLGSYVSREGDGKLVPWCVVQQLQNSVSVLFHSYRPPILWSEGSPSPPVQIQICNTSRAGLPRIKCTRPGITKKKKRSVEASTPFSVPGYSVTGLLEGAGT